jgi:hypothetical protein
MSLQTFRAALGSKLGQTVTPELCAWLEENAFDRFDHSHDPAKFGSKQYGGLTFQVERIADIQADIEPLHQAHYFETELHRHGLALDMDYAVLNEHERAGRLIQFTARDGDGKLVGNIRMYLYTSVHTQTLAAKEDVIFMLPQHRKGLTAIRFCQYADRCLEQIGVREIYTDTKVLHDEAGNVIRNVGRINEYMGYKLVSNGYHKSFGDLSAKG